MRNHFIKYLSDPVTHEPFRLIAFREKHDRVVDGLLVSGSSWYPIIGGIPRILLRELKHNLLQQRYAFYQKYIESLPHNVRSEWGAAVREIKNKDAFMHHQRKTAESFAYEWKYIYKENDYEKHNFFHFLSPFTKEADIQNKITLDVGCGSGRFTKWAALSGAQISFGTDLGETVEVAYRMTKDLDNVCIVQADVYAMPFKNVFDLVYSIGVLHHLPDPEGGFLMLSPMVREGGSVTIWVYNRRRNLRALCVYEPARSILRHLPKPVLFKIGYIPAFMVHVLNQITLLFREWNMPKLAKAIPFSYYANFPFNMKLNDTFDILATPKSNYYKVEEVEAWFNNANLDQVNFYEHPEAGITAVGQR